MFRRDVAFGGLRTVAEKELLHLLFHDFLRIRVSGFKRNSFSSIFEWFTHIPQASLEMLS